MPRLRNHEYVVDADTLRDRDCRMFRLRAAWRLMGGVHDVSQNQLAAALLGSAAAGAAAALARFPAPAVAQAKPFKLGLLTVKTGPLAAGGIQMEQGVLTYLKEKNFTLGGRKVDFISADTGGNPAGAKTKAQELVERDQVDVILGPLAAFELYAINDYVIEKKMPTLSLAAADNLTQRNAQSVSLARIGDVVAGDAADGALRGDRTEAQTRRHHLRGLCLRL